MPLALSFQFIYILWIFESIFLYFIIILLISLSLCILKVSLFVIDQFILLFKNLRISYSQFLIIKIILHLLFLILVNKYSIFKLIHFRFSIFVLVLLMKILILFIDFFFISKIIIFIKDLLTKLDSSTVINLCPILYIVLAKGINQTWCFFANLKHILRYDIT